MRKREVTVPPSSPASQSTNRDRDIWWYIVYIALWQPLFHLAPVGLLALGQPFAEAVANVVPSIGVYARNSPDPARVAFFMAVNWSLYPLYILLAFRRYKLLPLVEQPKFPSWSLGVFVTLGFIVLTPVPILLPMEISVDPRAMRPSRVWEKWMHEMLWPNGVFAVLLPLIGVLFLLCAVTLFRSLPFKSSPTRSS